MANHVAGVVVSGDKVTVVVANDDVTPIEIMIDDQFKLQAGDVSQAYKVMHQRVKDFFKANPVGLVLVKASAVGKGMKLAMLTSAELRGVVIAAAAECTQVKQLAKASVSKTFGERKVDEYLQDDAFWSGAITGGTLRSGSREAAMLIVANKGK